MQSKAIPFDAETATNLTEVLELFSADTGEAPYAQHPTSVHAIVELAQTGFCPSGIRLAPDSVTIPWSQTLSGMKLNFSQQ